MSNLVTFDDVVRETDMNAGVGGLLANPLYGCSPGSKSPPGVLIVNGDGVNVAARLEALADPGGICISDAVRTAVGKGLSLDYEDMGTQECMRAPFPSTLHVRVHTRG